MTMRPNLLAIRLFGLLGFMAMAPMAASAQSCAGTYAATALHPLAQPIVIGLDVRDSSPEHQVLAQRFLQGARDGGARTEGAPTVMIGVTYSVFGPAGGSGGGGVEHSYDDFGGFADGMNRNAPVFTGRMLRQQGQSQPRQPSMLTLRAEATPPGKTQVLWVMSLQCQMQASDPAVIAYEIGRVVGQGLGQTIARRAF